MNRHARTSRGFTIVELLIVVVIIAILAAITLVTYNGIQQRANNAAIIDAASKSLRMIQAYIAANDKYPQIGSLCITLATGCKTTSNTYSSNAVFNTNIATVGNVPQTIPAQGDSQFGIVYYYNASQTIDSQSLPVMLVYYLFGINQQCGLSGVLNSTSTSYSTTGYSEGNSASSGKTRCNIIVPGPTA